MSAITDFMAKYYTDERLAQLLAHAEDGKLVYNSCCCFIGIANADHTLSSNDFSTYNTDKFGDHYFIMKYGLTRQQYSNAMQPDPIPEVTAAEQGYNRLGISDSKRRTALIPIIRAEMERRARERQSTPTREPVYSV